MAEKVLYEAEVSELKRADKRNRVLRAIAVLVGELGFLLFLTTLLDVFGIVIFLILSFAFLPVPFVAAPNYYQITAKGIVLDSKRFFPFRRGMILRLNNLRLYVSIMNKLKKEVLRLYSKEPQPLLELIRKNSEAA